MKQQNGLKQQLLDASTALLDKYVTTSTLNQQINHSKDQETQNCIKVLGGQHEHLLFALFTVSQEIQRIKKHENVSSNS